MNRLKIYTVSHILTIFMNRLTTSVLYFIQFSSFYNIPASNNLTLVYEQKQIPEKEKV